MHNENPTSVSEMNYPVQIMGRHLEVSEAMKNYALGKLSKIERFGGKVIDAKIIMDIVKLTHKVEIIVDVNNTRIKVEASTTDMYSAIDAAIDKLKSKLLRYLSRLHNHHSKKAVDADLNVNVVGSTHEINDAIEEENQQAVESQFHPHPIMSHEKRRLSTLRVDEAIMKIELSGEHFLIFRAEEDQQLKLIYVREDGNYGIVELDVTK